jgi:ribosome maturation factor RimP
MKRSPVKPIQLSPETVRSIEAAVFQAVEPLLESRFYLLDVALEKEAGYWYLRIYVEETDGAISLNDCETISRALEDKLEALPQLSDLSYSLEVSSPGLFRPLKRQREFDFFIGRPVRIETVSSQALGLKKKPKKNQLALGAEAGLNSLEGILQGYNAEQNVVTLKRPLNDETFEVPLDSTQVIYLNSVIRFPDIEETAAEGADSNNSETEPSDN